MQIEIPDELIDALRDSLTPLVDRLIDEKVEQRRPLLLSVPQVAEELGCSRSSVCGLIHGGHLEAIQMGRSYRVTTETLVRYAEELGKPRYERSVVTASHQVGRAEAVSLTAEGRHLAQQRSRHSSRLPGLLAGRGPSRRGCRKKSWPRAAGR